MMCYLVEFTPEAQIQLIALYRYLAAAASPMVAKHYTQAIVAHCEGLQHFPYRSVSRDDIRPNLRITHYKKRTMIAFAVEGDRVSIIGVFHDGQDYEAAL